MSRVNFFQGLDIGNKMLQRKNERRIKATSRLHVRDVCVKKAKMNMTYYRISSASFPNSDGNKHSDGIYGPGRI